MSSTSPMRLMRKLLENSCRIGESGSSPRNGRSCGVSITPGDTQLTRTPIGESSIASVSVRRMTAALATQCTRFPGALPGMPEPTIPAIEPTLTIAPPPRRRSTGMAYFTGRNTSVTSCAMFQSQSATESSSTSPARGRGRVVVEDVEVAEALDAEVDERPGPVVGGEVDRMERGHLAARRLHHRRGSPRRRRRPGRSRRPGRPRRRRPVPPTAPARSRSPRSARPCPPAGQPSGPPSTLEPAPWSPEARTVSTP